jgi:hypothetical protein
VSAGVDNNDPTWVSVWTEATPVDQIWKKFGWFLGQPLSQ